MAKIRCGVAPIRLETGRYEGLPENERLYPVCLSQEVESEVHVISKCSLYDDLRSDLFNHANHFKNDFNLKYDILSDIEKFVFIMTNKDISKITAKTCHAILHKRRLNMYNSWYH